MEFNYLIMWIIFNYLIHTCAIHPYIIPYRHSTHFRINCDINWLSNELANTKRNEGEKKKRKADTKREREKKSTYHDSCWKYSVIDNDWYDDKDWLWLIINHMIKSQWKYNTRKRWFLPKNDSDKFCREYW